MPGNPTHTIFHGLALGVWVGGNSNFMFCIGGNTNLSVFRYQHVGIGNAKLWRWGSKANARTQREWFCVAVEYRLKK